jgi:hypothetical protein
MDIPQIGPTSTLALFAPGLKKSYWGGSKNKNETRNFNPVPLFKEF